MYNVHSSSDTENILMMVGVACMVFSSTVVLDSESKCDEEDTKKKQHYAFQMFFQQTQTRKDTIANVFNAMVIPYVNVTRFLGICTSHRKRYAF